VSIKLTWYGHACFQIEIGAFTLLTDPFLSANPLAPVKPENLSPDYILVSHGHSDHVGDTVSMAQRCDAVVISNFEIHNWLAAQGVKELHPQHIGGGYDYPWGRLKLTIAQHGSAMPDGSYGGNPCGFLLYLEEKKVYHACDTGLFYDMKLIGDEGIDLALLPIGDNFTMGPEDALRAVELIRPKRAVPIHYNTFDVIKQDAAAWAAKVDKTTAATAVVMTPGQSVEL
jgi:L-ascorbate metabolism protein UlaG (beta-lactamase superfamily)